MQIREVSAYEVVLEDDLKDIQSKGYLLRHKKTGARVMLISNEDENKVFNIAFRTPPADSTGVAHILEHSVLCGSEHFPLKDPFVELVKGSLNTFLNAMTYPDKTMYPVASCNDQDFQNLMHVYLDAVFYPNIYKKEEIFRQEGWSYQLESEDAPLKYNGVVYNEMKGVFSSAEEMIEREIFNNLFPDTPYGVESGGNPDYIPDLSYEDFLAFHKKYYHPSNSYIYLYGNMDMAEKLQWIDEHYLSSFDRITADSEIKEQKPFDRMVDFTVEYPILDSESEEDNTYLSWNKVVGKGTDTRLNVAFQILEYALLSAPGAPLKQVLLDEKIGKDIIGSYDDGIYQPFFSVMAKNAKLENKERFLELIEKTLRDQAKNGINKKALEAGINYFEFRFREADYASYPKGLMYGIDVFDSWLYDEEKPFDYLHLLPVYDELKQKISTGYFEELIETYLLNNTHGAVVTAVPKKGLAAEKERRTQEKLDKIKESASPEELRAMVEFTKHLKEFQEAEEDPEALKCIPMLKRSDIGKEAVQIKNEMRREADTDVVFHNIFTNGIGYLDLYYDTAAVPSELVPYMGLLKAVLGYVDTEHYSYSELFNEINANTGGIFCGLSVYGKENDRSDCLRMFGVRAKALYGRLGFVFDMIREILNTSRLDDTKRLYEILASQKSRLQMALPNSGHSTAMTRATSYFSPTAYFQDQISGIAYYQLIERLEANFDQEKEALIEKLKTLMKYIFRPENLIVSFTADEEGYAVFRECFEQYKEHMPAVQSVEPGRLEYALEQKNEAFKTAGQVQYVAAAGNFRAAGYEYTGAMRILKVIMSYDYLWMNLRVKGGAYGCMSGFRRNGDTFFVSYRDPNLKNTLDVYQGVPQYLREFQADEREMTKYVIGTISDLDTPLTPAAHGAMSLAAYFNGVTQEDLQREREEILNASAEDIRALEKPVQAVLDQKNICVVGSEAAIERDGELFREVKSLITC